MNSYEILTLLPKVYVNKEMLRLLTILPYPKGFNNTPQSIIPLITSIGNKIKVRPSSKDCSGEIQ